MVASLRTLPPLASVPAGVSFAVIHMAPHAGIAARSARNRMRLLRRNVTGLPLYACGPVTATHNVVWLVNGGSRKRGQAVVGVVSDRVRAVDVSLRGHVVRVRAIHNAFFVPFRSGQSGLAPMPRVRTITR
jgi:hypothetical protein